MTRIRTTTIARIKRMWMKPPRVYELTIPSSHKMSRITKIVQSIGALLRSRSVPTRKEGRAALWNLDVANEMPESRTKGEAPAVPFFAQRAQDLPVYSTIYLS
jgi:hypothetical protein